MAIRVRPMLQSDLDAVYRIECVAHQAPWDRHVLADCMMVGFDARVLEFVETADSRLIGYLIVRYVNHMTHVLNLSIAPDYQRQGYGSYFMQDLFYSIHGTLFTTVVLEVRPSNIGALNLYKKLGFEHAGVKERYYSDEIGVEDAIVLRKVLDR